ncbi:TonB-dependent receptor [Thalassotalea psychrophila]|uniref:TonB-dependent receptor n=1 Tax=Thalassotalea psychrophila TaxID=3065647 RepID=A0ABY9TRT7_9GAMM|nr:TonB-dependent receptor [Colwelliaceae bacterium SQ149]
MKTRTFNKTKLATSLSLILGASVITTTYAAEEVTAGDDVEIIEVTGIRGSLTKSVDIKRSSRGVVDAISAEDIGKFPDTNLAESLQRISGVSIDRDNGEGSKVTVRGFGPDYNLVTLNGRQMPTANINDTSASDSRSFDFGNLASEGVSAVEVYKTGRADVATGGIGSTINLVTIKPLNAGKQAAVSVKGVHDTSSEDGDSLTPELSGLYSDTFADGKFGVAITGSYQNRQSGSARAGVDNGWRPQTGGVGDWGSVGEGPNNINVPADGVTYAVPHNVLYGFSEVDRTRTNGQLTFQYRPVENLTATLDYTYSKLEEELNQNIHSVWMSLNYAGGSEWTDPDGDNVSAPMMIHDIDGPSDLVSQVEQSAKVNENDSIGLNLEYLVNDNLSFALDFHSSSAEAKPDSIYGNSNTIQMATWTRAETKVDFTSDFPVVEVAFPDGTNGLTPDDVRTTGTSFRNSYMKSEIEQVQLDGTYVFDQGVVESIDFGVGFNKVENRNAFAVAERPNWGGTGSADDIDDQMLLDSKDTMKDRFDNMPGNKSNMINEFWAVDFKTIADLVGDLYSDPSDTQAWPCGTTICAPSEYTTDRRTEEESTSAYLQANLAFEIGEMPAALTIGIRYEQTDVTSTTLLPDVVNLGWVSTNEFEIVRADDAVFFNGEGDYDYVLPNIDFNIEPLEDVIVRASYSETITRPAYGNLTAGSRLNEVRNGGATGSRGNPGLLPVESENIDLSLEYYYGEASYVSLGYFQKDVEQVVGNKIINESPYDVTDPASGARFDAAVAATGGDSSNSEAIRENIELSNPGDQYIIPAAGGAMTQIWGHPTENGILDVDFTQPVNQGSNKVDGFEFAIQHFFGDSGFGAMANLTVVDSDIDYDDGDFSGNQITPLLGVSDSYNIVAFYEKYGFQVRVAYNWRDDFLQGTHDGQGLNPVYVEDYGQLDANISYEFNENLAVFAEGINLTDEITRSYGRHQLMVKNIEQSGPRYNIGMRYKF